MQEPLELSFKNMEHDDKVAELVQEKLDHLERLHPGIVGCRVVIEVPHKRKQKGNLAEVAIDLRLPGGHLSVDQKQTDIGQHEHVSVAVRDSFAAMARKLQAWKEVHRGDVKTHETPLQGRIDTIDHDEGFGQILATDHRLVYFHKNSVVDGSFDDLKQGDTVELVVQTDESEIGPQASTVRPIGAMRFQSA